MPRFVILRHEPSPDSDRVLHWDLMLESGPVLHTWALSQEPTTGRTIDTEPLSDHRKAYLDYEGPVSGNRGHVRRWDHGTYEVESESADRLVVMFQGEKLHVTATLYADESDRWSVCFASG